MLIYQVDSITPELNLALETTHLLCEVINTPRSLAVSLMLQYQEWGEYIALSIDHSAYEDPRHFALDYLVTEILRKNENLPLGIDRKQVALDAFKASEALCYNTNIRIRQCEPVWARALRRNIARILGDLPQSDLDFVSSRFRFGPGATTGVRGQGSSLSDKYEKPIHLTTGLLPFFKTVLGERWHSFANGPHHIVEGNKFTTVPKTAKTDRGICVEPTLNIYVQLGIGALIRRKLQQVGIDLNKQDKNRYLAQIADRAELCTIDLSSASDSLSTELVHHYLPERWIHLLGICRSEKCSIGNEPPIELEKWSSMGNGYTFELESLIFTAVCKTFVPSEEAHHVSVYGDDIIVPRRYATQVIDALNFLGFRVNQQKSFLAGSFFESCGHDYFKGQNVRPFYLKSERKDIPFALQTANKLRAWCHRLNHGVSCDNTFEDVWRHLVRKIPRTWRRLYVPFSFGDSGLNVSFEEARPDRAKDGVEGYVVRHISCTPKHRRKETFGVLLANLARIETIRSMDDLTVERRKALFLKGKEPLRGLFGRSRSRKTIVRDWSCSHSWENPLH